MAENLKPKIAIILEDKELESEIGAALEEDYELDFFSNGVVLYNSLQRQKERYTFIISVSDLKGLHGFRLKKTIDKLGFADIPFFLITHPITKEVIQDCIQNGIIDVFPLPLRPTALKIGRASCRERV